MVKFTVLKFDLQSNNSCFLRIPAKILFSFFFVIQVIALVENCENETENIPTMRMILMDCDHNMSFDRGCIMHSAATVWLDFCIR